MEGKLVAPWATELRTACHKAKADLGGRELVVDLRGLMVISQEGENVVLELMNEGIRFQGSGVFTTYVISNIARRMDAKTQELKW